MNWAQFAFGLSDVLSLVLVIRLIRLRLHDVYRVFCAFLLFQVLSESFAIVERFTSLDAVVDYRLTWLVMRVLFWSVSIWMVYALLRAIFAGLPGILRFSRKTLHVVLPVSVLIALATAVPEYLASGVAGAKTELEYAVRIAFILDRLVATIAVLTLLITLAFILWFPVTMPRNLAVFSVGFIVYFTSKTALLLVHSFWTHGNVTLLNNGVTFILCICLTCWIIFLNREGQIRPVTIGHIWQPSDRSELLHNLEALNTSLARAARR